MLGGLNTAQVLKMLSNYFQDKNHSSLPIHFYSKDETIKTENSQS